MVSFKVLGLTAQYPLQVPNNTSPGGDIFFRRVSGGAELDVQFSQPRVAAIVEVFNSGRDCFYDEKKKVFSTDPSTYWREYLPVSGFVTHWDVRIPAGGKAEIRVTIQQAGDPSELGHAVILTVPDDRLAIALAVVRSRRCYYDAGSLRTFNFSPAP